MSGSPRLIDRSDPRLRGPDGQRFEGEVSVDDLARVRGGVKPFSHGTDDRRTGPAEDLGLVRYILDARLDTRGYVYVTGSVEARVMLECQRCFGPLVHHIRASIAVGIVRSEDDLDRLPRELEPLIAPEDRIPVVDVVEDEIILALPVAPLHDYPCIELPGSESEEPPAQRENPFAVLSGLKRNREN
ncbi:MAG: YceD family protein [Gammaproteobacteria bacterium]